MFTSHPHTYIYKHLYMSTLCNNNLYSLCLKHIKSYYNNNVLTYVTPLGQWIMLYAHLTYIIINLTNMNVICSINIHLHLNVPFTEILLSHKQNTHYNTPSSLIHIYISHNTYHFHVVTYYISHSHTSVT